MRGPVLPSLMSKGIAFIGAVLADVDDCGHGFNHYAERVRVLVRCAVHEADRFLGCVHGEHGDVRGFAEFREQLSAKLLGRAFDVGGVNNGVILEVREVHLCLVSSASCCVEDHRALNAWRHAVRSREVVD